MSRAAAALGLVRCLRLGRARAGRPRRFASLLVTRLWRALAGQPRLLWQFGLLALLVQTAKLGAPLLTRMAVDTALPAGAASMLSVLALALVLLALHWAWLEWLRQGVIRALDASLAALVLRGVFGHLLALPASYRGRRSVGELLQCMSSTETTTALAGQVAVPLIDAVAALTYILAIAAYLPGLALALAAVGIALGLVAAVYCRRFGARQAGVLAASARQRAFLYEILEGAAAIKLAAARERAVAKWIRRLAAYQAAVVRQLRVGLRLELVTQGASQLVVAAVFTWGGQRALSGDISLGAFLSSLLLAQAFIASILALAHATLPLFSARSDVGRVDELLAVEPAPEPGPIGAAGGVSLEDVWFRHAPDAPWILRGYCLRVAPGEHATIRGPSGAGKSTILSLIAGLCVPERGRVTVGGIDASAVHARSIAYLPQEVSLLEGSIMDNLTLLSEAPPERILSAAEATGLAALVARMPMRYETPLPPGGHSLSGGQRQLIALTACIAGGQPVVLLDEAFAHIDKLTRRQIGASNSFVGRTVISVEHDAASAHEGRP